MKHILVSSLFALLAPAVALAQPADKAKAPVAPGEPAPPPPEVAQTVKAFEGNWSFDAKITMPGATEPAKFKVKMVCKKIAAGAGVACTGTGKVPKLGPWNASVLVGHDPSAGGRTHFMAITNLGEVHDHQCTWAGTKLNCDPLKYGTATEALSFEWTDPKTASFRSETKDKSGTILFEATGKRPKAPK